MTDAPCERAGHPRIVTLTLNPAIDVACRAPRVVPTHKIRTFDERIDAGGGGINVARVLRALGADTLALIATGGVIGQLVEELLDREGISWQRVAIAGRTRISLNAREEATGLEYRFVPEGPEFRETEWQAALAALRGIDAAWIVASGSLPRNVPEDFYARAAALAAARRQKFVLDTSGPALRAALGQGIALLKLSLGELEYLVSSELRTPEKQAEQADALRRAGAAEAIAVSLGRDGALLATERGSARIAAPPVTESSAVGAGDSFLAALVLGLAHGMADRDALALAVAAGSAAVTGYGTAHVSRTEVAALFRSLAGEAAAWPL